MDQLKENLDPPRFRMQTVAGQGGIEQGQLNESISQADVSTFM
jgi:hypothetical protein